MDLNLNFFLDAVTDWEDVEVIGIYDFVLDCPTHLVASLDYGILFLE